MPDLNELNLDAPPISLDTSLFHGTLRKAKDEADKNCWSSPDGSGFVIRGKTYLKDSMKVGALISNITFQRKFIFDCLFEAE